MKLIVFFFIIVLTTNNILAEENKMIMKLKNGSVEIELYPEIAPGHVKRFTELVEQKKYDGVVFHRVIDGFMAQTGDVKYGNSTNDNFNLSLAGTGGSDLPDLKAEFSDLAHTKGVLSAARSADPNSANSQFFIVLDAAPHLDRQYTAYGKVIKGMEFIEMIKKGDPQSGSVDDPDKIISITLKK
jgi:cyclophilin family peptidyl-prolyl cis-trans isomerase